MKLLYTTTALAAFLLFSPVAHATTDGNDPEVLVKEGKFFGEMRYRYEHVDQDNTLSDANAHTVRTNLGFQTGVFHGFGGLIEGQIVQQFGDEEFNSLDNGQTTYSVVADPDTTEINRAWIEYTGIPSTSIKLGRQFINWDNQRFIGTVGWRQNDQTFDAVTLFNDSIDNLSLRYSYVDKVHRIFEGSVPPDDLEGHIHLANISYKLADWMTATAYGYWMNFDNESGLTAATANQSNRTYGGRLTGKAPITEDWTFSYEAEYATQSDHGDSTLSYDEDYYHIAPKIAGYGVTLGAGYEVLEGDGTNSFRTPLATLHKFNGWADTFLTTPANGLEDAYLTLGYKFSNTGSLLDGLNLGAAYHDFKGNEAGEYGNEFDVSINRKFMLPDAGQPFKDVNVTLKYADYNADDAPYVDTKKFWIQIGTKF